MASFTVDASMSAYAAGPFAPVPRTSGVAAITSGAARAGVTRIVLAKAEEVKAAVGAGGDLAVADAETEAVVVSYAGGVRTLYASVGAKATVASSRKAVTAAIAKAKALKAKDADVQLPKTAEGDASLARIAQAVTQAAALSNYHFDRYLTVESKLPHNLSSIHIVTDDAAAAAEVSTAATLATATIFARDLVNERADEMHPARLEAVARAVAAEAGMKVHTVVGAELEKQGLHLMHAVGQAARHAPRYIELTYEGDPSHPGDVIALVGKGVCFDSGGLNIKGTGFMEDMHMDMGGAAAVLGTALAVSRLGVKANIVFVVGAVENAVDALSFKPHAIIRSHKGLTVENGNTDAEGRLVLADALSLVQERHKPTAIIDLATLTGACVIALGEPLAGAFSNSKALREALLAAGDARFERCWPMPILAEHRAELTGTPFADLKSTGEGRYGGACTAAAFLENFVGGGKADKAYRPAWCHLDIAGPAMYSKDRGHMKKGGTGFGVQLLTEFLINRAASGAAFAPTEEEA